MQETFLLLPLWLWVIVLLLTVSGTAFSFAKYELGKKGMDAILESHPNFGKERLDTVARLFDRHGSVTLLLAGIPGIDTIVTTTAGAVGVAKGKFILWVTLGKLARFWLLAVIVVGVTERFT